MSDHNSNGDYEITKEGDSDGQEGDGEEGDDWDYGEEGDVEEGDQNSTGSGAQDDQLSNHSELNEWQFRDRLKYKISDPSELDKLVDLECTILYDKENLA